MSEAVSPDEIEVPAPAKRGGNHQGRPRGSKNKRTAEFDAAVTKAAAEIGDVADGHELLRAIYKCQTLPLLLRMEAASRALKVEKPTLAATAISADINLRVANIAVRLDAALERERIAVELEGRALAADNGTVPPPPSGASMNMPPLLSPYSPGSGSRAAGAVIDAIAAELLSMPADEAALIAEIFGAAP